jgi:hypothetical protein
VNLVFLLKREEKMIVLQVHLIREFIKHIIYITMVSISINSYT